MGSPIRQALNERLYFAKRSQNHRFLCYFSRQIKKKMIKAKDLIHKNREP